MKLIGLWPTFFGLAFVIILSFTLFAKLISQNVNDWKYWTCCFLLCYPFLFALQRGNFFSLITTVLIFNFVVLVIKKHHLMIATICLALAINIRPNAVFFLPFLVTLGFYSGLKRATFCLLLTILVFGVCLALGHSLYPDYDFINFLRGLALYHQEHVVGDGGDAFNSAPFILMKKSFGYYPIEEMFGVLFSIVISITGLDLFFKKLLSSVKLLLILTFSYLCSSPVFGDYHLLIFFLPIIALAVNFPEKHSIESFPWSNKIIILSCLFLLASKNYWFSGGGISWLILFNPLVVICLSVWVLINSFQNTESLADN